MLGVGVLLYSLSLPYYKDQRAAEELQANAYDMHKVDYYTKDAALRTGKITYMDMGAGIAIASSAILLFLLITGLHTFSDFKRIRTPRRATIFIMTNMAWLSVAAGNIWYYIFRLGRGDYPPFADSIGIAVVPVTFAVLFMFIPLNVFLLFSLFRSRLPCRIYKKADHYTAGLVLWEVIFDLLILSDLLYCIATIVDGDHINILVALYFLYILLSLRAGKIAHSNDVVRGANDF